MLGISLFGWLDKIPLWRDLKYPLKGALLRALKAGAAFLVGSAVAALAAGTLLPVGISPIIVLVVTVALQSADKFLRENEMAKDNGIPLDPVPNADTDATVIDAPVPVEPVPVDTTTESTDAP